MVGVLQPRLQEADPTVVLEPGDREARRRQAQIGQERGRKQPGEGEIVDREYGRRPDREELRRIFPFFD